MSIGLCGDPLYFKRNCNGCGAEPKYAGNGEGSHEEKKLKLLLEEMDKALGKLMDQIHQRLMLNGVCPYCGAGKKSWDKVRYVEGKVMRTKAEDMLRTYECRIGSNKQKKAEKCLAVIAKNSKRLTELFKLEQKKEIACPKGKEVQS